jgi:hypothetical protein
MWQAVNVKTYTKFQLGIAAGEKIIVPLHLNLTGEVEKWILNSKTGSEILVKNCPFSHQIYPQLAHARSKPGGREDYITRSFMLCIPHQIPFG